MVTDNGSRMLGRHHHMLIPLSGFFFSEISELTDRNCLPLLPGGSLSNFNESFMSGVHMRTKVEGEGNRVNKGT